MKGERSFRWCVGMGRLLDFMAREQRVVEREGEQEGETEIVHQRACPAPAVETSRWSTSLSLTCLVDGVAYQTRGLVVCFCQVMGSAHRKWMDSRAR